MNSIDILTHILSGAAKTEPLTGDYGYKALDGTVYCCALGAGRYDSAGLDRNDMVITFMPDQYVEAEQDLRDDYLMKYGRTIVQDNDRYGRQQVLERLQALYSTNCQG